MSITVANIIVMGFFGGFLGWNANWSGIACVLAAYAWGMFVGSQQ